METRHCPFCAEEIKINAKVCKHCNNKLEKHCINCSEVIKGEATACKHCGHNQNRNVNVSSTEKSRSTAIILALFTGGFGGHKFYLNRPMSGILSLLFCWTFIPAILAIIEIILYATYTEEQWANYVNLKK